MGAGRPEIPPVGSCFGKTPATVGDPLQIRRVLTCRPNPGFSLARIKPHAYATSAASRTPARAARSNLNRARSRNAFWKEPARPLLRWLTTMRCLRIFVMNFYSRWEPFYREPRCDGRSGKCFRSISSFWRFDSRRARVEPGTLNAQRLMWVSYPRFRSRESDAMNLPETCVG